jgi:hypothetical protein
MIKAAIKNPISIPMITRNAGYKLSEGEAGVGFAISSFTCERSVLTLSLLGRASRSDSESTSGVRVAVGSGVAVVAEQGDELRRLISDLELKKAKNEAVVKGEYVELVQKIIDPSR